MSNGKKKTALMKSIERRKIKLADFIIQQESNDMINAHSEYLDGMIRSLTTDLALDVALIKKDRHDLKESFSQGYVQGCQGNGGQNGEHWYQENYETDS